MGEDVEQHVRSDVGGDTRGGGLGLDGSGLGLDGGGLGAGGGLGLGKTLLVRQQASEAEL